MRKFALLTLAAVALMLALPQFAGATPLTPGGLSTAADSVSNTEQVWHRRWHRRCVHRRHWSGSRCW